MKIKLLGSVIIILALVVRIWQLGDVPAGLHADEVSFIINAEAIRQTGRDEDNRLFPVILESIKDSKPALYSYLQIPAFALFGPTAFASRLPSVILGLLSLYLAYRLIYFLTKNTFLALVTMAVLALSPWHIMNSRSTQEVILSFVFVQCSLIYYVEIVQTWLLDKEKSFKELPVKKIILLSLFTLLAMHVYHSAKIVLVVFFFGSSLLLLLKQTSKQLLQKHAVVLAFISVAFFVTAAAAFTRFNAIGLQSSDIPKINTFEFTTLSTNHTPLLVIRFFYNKITMYGLLFVDQYLAHFSPTYFFTKGGMTDRHFVPLHGIFYLIEAALMILGLYRFLSIKNLREGFPFWLLFLLAAPIPAALTTEDIPSSIRSFFLILPLSFLIALGFETVLKFKNIWTQRLTILLIIGGYMWGVSYFIQQFFVVMPQYRPWHRSDDYAVAAKRIAEIEKDYERVVITNNLRELYIYLWQEDKITIQDIQAQPFARYKHDYNIGKYYFNQDSCLAPEAIAPSLILTSLNCDLSLHDKSFLLLEQVEFRDGTPALNLYKKVALEEI